jgi:hypothetical protein
MFISHDELILPKVDMEHKKFELLAMLEMPSLSAPWSSVDSGETWIWGDFFLTFQKKPKIMYEQNKGVRDIYVLHEGMARKSKMTLTPLTSL